MRSVHAPLLLSTVALLSCASAPPLDSPPPGPTATAATTAAQVATSAPSAASAAPQDTATVAPTAAPTASVAAVPGGPSAPTPYTAAQIRDASPAGRRIVFRVELAGKPASLHVIEFLSSDANGAEIRSSETDIKNKVLGTKTERSTWEELRLHAVFPNAQVLITTGKNPGPMGPLDCVIYKVVDQMDATTVTSTFYFAKTLPGPPVFMTVEKNGTKVRTMTMESSTTSK